MTTKIYDNYEAFLKRENKKENGVSKFFAELHPDWEAKNTTNEACWNCSYCSGCSDCSDCSVCSDCRDCSGCSGCSDCSVCSDCRDCSVKKGAEENAIQIPIVENIHQKVLAAVSQPGCFEMNDWHSCSTTHCRGGWVIALAGEAGAKLEKQTSSEFAAKMIYHKSSPIRVSPVRFYESNEVAMADIKRCAEEEIKLG